MNVELEPYTAVSEIVDDDEHSEREPSPPPRCTEQIGFVAVCAACPLLRMFGECPKEIRERTENELLSSEDGSTEISPLVELEFGVPAWVVEESGEPAPERIIEEPTTPPAREEMSVSLLQPAERPVKVQKVSKKVVEKVRPIVPDNSPVALPAERVERPLNKPEPIRTIRELLFDDDVPLVVALPIQPSVTLEVREEPKVIPVLEPEREYELDIPETEPRYNDISTEIGPIVHEPLSLVVSVAEENIAVAVVQDVCVESVQVPPLTIQEDGTVKGPFSSTEPSKVVSVFVNTAELVDEKVIPALPAFEFLEVQPEDNSAPVIKQYVIQEPEILPPAPELDTAPDTEVLLPSETESMPIDIDMLPAPADVKESLTSLLAPNEYIETEELEVSATARNESPEFLTAATEPGSRYRSLILESLLGLFALINYASCD